MRYSKLLVSAMVSATFLVASVASSGSLEDPQQIMNEVKNRGARAVVNELYDDESKWVLIIEKISSGEAAWIDVALALKPGSDAGATSMLRDAMFEALGKHPGYVLSRAEPNYPIALLCRGRCDALSTFERAMAGHKAIATSVEKVSTEQLKERKAACLRALEEGRLDLLRFFGRSK